jgi:hypothetical protein
MNIEEIKKISDADRFSDEVKADNSEDRFLKALFAGILAAIVCAVFWMTLTFIMQMQIGFMAIGIGLGVGFAIRSVSRSRAPKFALIAGACSFLGWLLGTIATFPMFPSLSIYDYLFCLLAVAEGVYFIAYSRLGPEVDTCEDELDVLLREKEEHEPTSNKTDVDETDDPDDDYVERRHHNPFRGKTIYEKVKNRRRGPLI